MYLATTSYALRLVSSFCCYARGAPRGISLHIRDWNISVPADTYPYLYTCVNKGVTLFGKIRFVFSRDRRTISRTSIILFDPHNRLFNRKCTLSTNHIRVQTAIDSCLIWKCLVCSSCSSKRFKIAIVISFYLQHYTNVSRLHRTLQWILATSYERFYRKYYLYC